MLKLGNISLDGSKIQADASKSKAVSFKRLIEIETQLRKEVGELFDLGEQVDQGEKQLPEEMILQDEIAIREERLANLAQAKAALEARAKERYEAEQAEYEAKLREREKKTASIIANPKDALVINAVAALYLFNGFERDRRLPEALPGLNEVRRLHHVVWLLYRLELTILGVQIFVAYRVASHVGRSRAGWRPEGSCPLFADSQDVSLSGAICRRDRRNGQRLGHVVAVL